MYYYTATIKTRTMVAEINITAEWPQEAEELANQFAVKHWGGGYEVILNTAEPPPQVTIKSINLR